MQRRPVAAVCGLAHLLKALKRHIFGAISRLQLSSPVWGRARHSVEDAHTQDWLGLVWKSIVVAGAWENALAETLGASGLILHTLGKSVNGKSQSQILICMAASPEILKPRLGEQDCQTYTGPMSFLL